MNIKEKFKAGILTENPVFMQTIGLCPTLATSTTITNALGMTAAATAVLICSNIVISILRNFIPDKVRIASYITIIASFVTLIQMLLNAYVPSVAASLGLFLPLIVVNCIILGRAEMFASKNGVVDSALDGIGMGIGFTLSLTVMGAVRELIGAGTIFGFALPWMSEHPMMIIALAPGGFFIYACAIAAINLFTKGKGVKGSFGCQGCAMASICQQEKCLAELEKGVEA